MEEAEKIATEFVKTKKPQQKIEVASVEPKNSGWLVKGSNSSSTPTGSSSEKWTVEIKDGNIVSYRFEPGFFFAIA
jgi:hypothetical protein